MALTPVFVNPVSADQGKTWVYNGSTGKSQPMAGVGGINAGAYSSLSTAIDQALSSGLPLYVPAGAYDLSAWTTKVLTGPLAIAFDPLAIITGPARAGGQHFVSTAFNLTISGGQFTGFRSIVKLSATAALRRIAMDGVVYSDGGPPIYCTDADAPDLEYLRMRDCIISSCYAGLEVFLDTLNSGLISGNLVSGCQNGIYLHEVTLGVSVLKGVSIKDNTVINTQSPAGTTAYGILCSAEHASISGNYIESVTTVSGSPPNLDGIYLRAENIKVSDNTVVGPIDGEAWINSKLGYASIIGNRLIEPTGAGSTAAGMKLEYGNTVVAENTFRGFTEYCIYTGSAGSNAALQIVKNQFTGLAASGTKAAIALQATYVGVDIEGNRCYGHQLVSFVNSGTCSAVRVRGNQILTAQGGGSGSIGIAVGNGSALTGLEISGNQFDGMERGVVFYGAGSTGADIFGNSWANISWLNVQDQTASTTIVYTDQFRVYGTPEGAVTAPPGSTAARVDGSTSTSFYVKTSGTGNTGWTAK